MPTPRRGRDSSEVEAPEPDAPAGHNERAVRADLEDLISESPVEASLCAAAITLARQLDAGAGMATAAVVRELRATLDALTKGVTDGDPLDAEIAGLSTPV